MKRKVLLVCLVAMMSSTPLLGYEIETHGAITQQTYPKTALLTSYLLTELGVEASDNPFGDKYYDVSDANVEERAVYDDYEGVIIDRLGEPTLSIRGWLMRGTIREDDLPCPKSPCDDPVNALRPLNHFFDPVLNQPLTVGVPLGAKAFDWVTGTVDAYAEPPAPNTNRLNHYSLIDAQEAMWQTMIQSVLYLIYHQFRGRPSIFSLVE